MWWIIIIGIIGFILYSFLSSRNKSRTVVDQEGGMKRKYEVLLENLLEAPNASITRLTRDNVAISGRSKYIVYQYSILHSFDDVLITWVAKSGFGDLKDDWTFPSNFDQEKMAMKIIQDVDFKLKNFMDYEATAKSVKKEIAKDNPGKSKFDGDLSF
jgi:hypothetical protein